jgi:ABC-type arginine transport system permease subunit
MYMHKSAGNPSPLNGGTPKGNPYTRLLHIGALYIAHIGVYSMVRYSHMDVQVSRRPYTMYVSICALYMIHIGVVYSTVR